MVASLTDRVHPVWMVGYAVAMAITRGAAVDVDRLVDALAHSGLAVGSDRADVRVVHAPGRVNLIGEHTDYNDGFVLPAAIDLGVSIAFWPTEDRRIELISAESGELAAIDLEDIGPRRGTWADYIAGTAWAMVEAGLPISGFRGVLDSTLPAGAGLSSSAAIELAAAWALSRGDEPAMDPMRLAQTAQHAENAYVGVRCGLMDQFAVVFGRVGHAQVLDCRSLEHRPVALPAGVALIVCHTGQPRRLATSEFNTRRQECERAAAEIARLDDRVRALRDVSPELLERSRPRLDATAFRRARHVVGENGRVMSMISALERGDIPAIGQLLAASHASLRDDFEVSSHELDALVEVATMAPGTIGARMTGAGFGGCTINLVHDDAVDGFGAAMLAGYRDRTGLVPGVFMVRAVDGAHRVADAKGGSVA